MSDVPLRLALDVAAIAALVYGIYLPRYRRMDLVVVYALFNLGLFLAIVVITRGEVTLGIGLGLFAVLSMIRLRSETFSNRELERDDVVVALVLALVTAIDVGGLAAAAALAAVGLVAAWVIDHPRLQRPTRRLDVTLELVFTDPEALRRHLEERLNAQVTEARVVEIDYVRETTRAVAHYVAGPRTKPVPEEALDATVAGRPR